MRHITLAALAAILFVVASGAVCSGDRELADLAWMVGTWGSESHGVRMEEHWIEARGGMMLGLHRDIPPSGKAFFEYLRIESGDEGTFYVASPRGRQGTPFRLIESAEQRVVFSNPEHDYPQRILYWLENDTLCARIEGSENGKEKSSEWRWKRR